MNDGMRDDQADALEPDPETGLDAELRDHLLQDIEVGVERQRLERRVHRALIAFGAALLVVICLAIWASTIRARTAVTVYGDGYGGDEQPSAFRFAARDPKTGAALTIDHADVELETTSGVVRPVTNVLVGSDLATAALFVQPEEMTGGARLVVRMLLAGEEDRIEVPLRAAPPAGLGIRLVDAREALQKPEDIHGVVAETPRFPELIVDGEPVELRFYPEGGQLVPVLANDLWMLALGGGRPRAELEITVDPPGWTVTTDTLGMGRLHLTPGRDHGVLAVRQGQPASEDGVQIVKPDISVRLATPPTQLLARTAQILVAPGDSITVQISSVRLRTWLAFEVWYGARLVAMEHTAVDGGRTEITLPAPARPRTVVAVRLTRNPIGVGAVTSTAFIYVDDVAAPEAWRHLVEDLGPELESDAGLRALAGLTIDDPALAERNMRLALSRANLVAAAVPQLADNSARNHSRAAVRRQAWQRWIFGLYWLLGLGALGFSCGAVVLHSRRFHQRLAQLDLEDPESELGSSQVVRRRGYLELLAVVIGVLFGLVTVYQLLANLWWG